MDHEIIMSDSTVRLELSLPGVTKARRYTLEQLPFLPITASPRRNEPSPGPAPQPEALKMVNRQTNRRNLARVAAK
jgi:hypothetical protein